MTSLLKTLWKIITYPFVLIYRIVTFPFRAIRNAYRFLNEVPEENPMMDVVTGVVTDAEIRANLWQQFDDFRKHLLRAVIVLIGGVGVSFNYTIPLMNYLSAPVGGLSSLQAIEVTEEIGVFMRVALMSGIAVTLPYTAFELWWFAAPGLRPGSRRFGLIAIPLATFLFVCGMAFAYYIMMPAALPFLLDFMGIQAELRPASYFSFITGVMFWIGVAFEFPLVIYVLTAIGFVKPKALSDNWRIAIVLIAVLAAAITPTV
ncbi:MAG: twin-arginine translocase subunit TatC, partial [Anaerolineales bacterium]|nr:twin-arginine translocase subunit TatC [Anaerolineales bacterium]